MVNNSARSSAFSIIKACHLSNRFERSLAVVFDQLLKADDAASIAWFACTLVQSATEAMTPLSKGLSTLNVESLEIHCPLM